MKNLIPKFVYAGALALVLTANISYAGIFGSSEKIKLPSDFRIENLKGGFKSKELKIVIQPNEDKPGTFIVGVISSQTTARMFYGSLVPSSNTINLMGLQPSENNEEVVVTNPVGKIRISRQSNNNEYFIELTMSRGGPNGDATTDEYRLKSYHANMGFDALTNMALYKGSSCIFKKDKNLFDINVEKTASISLETKSNRFTLSGDFKLNYDFVGLGVLRKISFNKNSVISEEAKISGFVVVIRDGTDLDLVVANTTKHEWANAVILPYGK